MSFFSLNNILDKFYNSIREIFLYIRTFKWTFNFLLELVLFDLLGEMCTPNLRVLFDIMVRKNIQRNRWEYVMEFDIACGLTAGKPVRRLSICHKIGFRLWSDRNVTNPKPITVYGILASIFRRMKMTAARWNDGQPWIAARYRMTPSIPDFNPLSDI